MGQSITPPSSRQHHSNNRIGTRSLQRSHRSSVHLQRQASISPSRISTQNIDQMSKKIDQSTKTVEKIERINEGLSKKQIYSLKSDNHTGVNRQSLRGDESAYSPNFKQLAEVDQDYCVSQWRMPVQSKRIEKSNSQTQHEITISFSKTKNINSHHLHEETIVSKQNLFKILEDQEHSKVEEQRNENLIKSAEVAADQNYPNENSLLESLKDKQTFEKEVISCNNVNKKQNALKSSRTITNKQLNSQNSVDHSSKKQLENNIVQKNQEFNDYDLRQQNKDIDGQSKRKLKLSKRLLQLKQKIITMGSTSELKSQFLKSSSLHNLFKSVGSIRACDGTINQDKIIRGNYEQKRTGIQKEMQIDKEKISNDNKHQVKNEDQRQQTCKILIDKPKNNSTKSSKLIIFNGNDAYSYPNVSSRICKSQKSPQVEQKLSNSHGNQSSIREIIKKAKIELEPNDLTSSGGLKQSKILKKDFNKKTSNIYRPTVGEEYDLINYKFPTCKQKNMSTKLENKASNKPSSQQQINHQRPMSINFPNMSQGKNIDSRLFHKTRTKESESKGLSSELKKRYKSSQSKSMLKMKLLIF